MFWVLTEQSDLLSRCTLKKLWDFAMSTSSQDGNRGERYYWCPTTSFPLFFFSHIASLIISLHSPFSHTSHICKKITYPSSEYSRKWLSNVVFKICCIKRVNRKGAMMALWGWGRDSCSHDLKRSGTQSNRWENDVSVQDLPGQILVFNYW